jgi:hypothetical protein
MCQNYNAETYVAESLLQFAQRRRNVACVVVINGGERYSWFLPIKETVTRDGLRQIQGVRLTELND